MLQQFLAAKNAALLRPYPAEPRKAAVARASCVAKLHDGEFFCRFFVIAAEAFLCEFNIRLEDEHALLRFVASSPRAFDETAAFGELLFAPVDVR